MTRALIAIGVVTAALAGCPTTTTPPDPAPAQAPLADAGPPAVAPTPPPNETLSPKISPIPRKTGVADKDNDAVRKATWDKWDLPAMEACSDAHTAQVEKWVLALCRTQFDVHTPGGEIAGHMKLPQLPLSFSAPQSAAVFMWDSHTTEVPDNAGIGGRKAQFRDKPTDSPFHEKTIKAAMPQLKDVPILAVDGSRPVSEVARALSIFQKAGHSTVAFAFETTAYPVALPPKPKVLEKFQWQTAAPYMREAAKGCDALTTAFQTFAGGPPDARCAPLAGDIGAAMKTCNCKMADQQAFLGNLHLLLRPPKIVTVVTVRLGGKPITLPKSQTWAEASKQLFAAPREGLRLRLR